MAKKVTGKNEPKDDVCDLLGKILSSLKKIEKNTSGMEDCLGNIDTVFTTIWSDGWPPTKRKRSK